MEAGVRDVHYMPVYMKKNGPAYQLNALCTKEDIRTNGRDHILASGGFPWSVPFCGVNFGLCSKQETTGQIVMDAMSVAFHSFLFWPGNMATGFSWEEYGRH